MKGFQVVVVTVLIVASTQAAGSGPYLPSGWRPDGPAFLLPGEISESPAVPPKSAQESLAAGFDSLREYGPPKLEEVLQDITQQALPDEATGPPFYIIRADIHENIRELEGEAVTTEKYTEDEESLGTTEVSVYVTTKTQSETEAMSTRLDSVEATSKDDESEPTVKKTEKTSNIMSNNDTVSKTEEKSDNVIPEETTANNAESETEKFIKMKSDKINVYEAQVKLDVDDTETNYDKVLQVFKQEKESDRVNGDEKKTNAKDELSVFEKNKQGRIESGVNNIAEALINVEKEIKDQQAQGNAEVNKVADITVAGRPIPEGFLEYGPPGFKEYGPPTFIKVTAEQPSTDNEVDNALRKRRLSPKFKTHEN